jgi:hypothetical protein
MTSTLLDSRVAATLNRMFAEADAQMPMLGEMFGKDAVPAESDAQQRADALSEFSSVTPSGPPPLHSRARVRYRVEFGMSLGISVIHCPRCVTTARSGLPWA